MAAFIVAILSVMMTLVSIVLFCIETLPYFEYNALRGRRGSQLSSISSSSSRPSVPSGSRSKPSSDFISCPDKLEFWKDFKNIVDVLAVVPYYWTLFNVLSTMNCSSAKASASLSFLRIIRLIRVFKLTKHSVGLQVLLLTFKSKPGRARPLLHRAYGLACSSSPVPFTTPSSVTPRHK